MKRLIKLSLLALSTSVAFSLLLSTGFASAATFNQNKILDDAVFDNYNSMNASQIDAFLNQFASSCISSNNGFTAPDPTGYTPTTGFSFGGNVTAGKVIYDAAQAYNLNPQVLIATLQKEQSLVTGEKGCHPNTPDPTQTYQCDLYGNGTIYNCTNACPFAYGGGCIPIAVGYGCPGSCNAAQEGFSQQIIRAAWFFKFGEQRSEGNINWAIIKPNWDNSDDPQSCYSGPMTQGTWQRCPSGASVYYDGYTTIDGTSVHMDDGATAALYWYTPHFSGNESFFNIFTSWFVPFSWQPSQQSAYTDATMTNPVDTTNLLPGQRVYLVIKALNAGSATWQKGTYGQQVNVGTSNPDDRRSAFCDSSWLGANCNRPATTAESSVAPGGTGTFGFWATAPGQAGTYNEYFNLVADGTTWLNDPGLYWTFVVRTPSWQPVQQSAYTDSTTATPVDTLHLGPGQKYYLLIKAKNTGTTAWQKGVYAQQVNVGTSRSQDRKSAFCDSTWLGSDCNRAATAAESSVAPGSVGTFGFWITTPNTTGTYNEYFNLVMDGTSWLNDPGLYWTLRVDAPQPSWQPVQQSAYTDSTMATPIDILNLTPGQRFYLYIKAKNTGNVAWQKGVFPWQVNVGTSHPEDRKSTFCDSSWLNTNCNRTATTTENSVPIGQTGSFGFWATAPSQAGTYNEYFNLVMDGTSWLNDPGLYWTLVVK